MSTDPDNHSKLAFSTRCLPGSVAEQKEKERLAEFHRCKTEREAEAARNKPQVDAKHQAKYQAAYEAHLQRVRKGRAPLP